MPIAALDHPEKLKFNLTFFTILVTYINRRMFEIGLPVRGAVHIGDVIISKRCFAGKAIVDAHTLAKRTKIAGTVISEQANAFIFESIPARSGFDSMLSTLIIECGVLSDINTSEKIKTLCWFYLQMGRTERFNIPSDLKRFITEQFTAHGKTLSGDEEKRKVSNTEKLFEDWKSANYLEYQRIKAMHERHL